MGNSLDSPEGYSVILTTTANEADAQLLAEGLVTQRLAACVQVQNIKSFYVWQGEACSEPECLLLIKSRTADYDSIEKFIIDNHNYEVPEIVMLPIQNGLPSYLSWIDTQTTR